jgi:hypothetical protein
MHETDFAAPKAFVDIIELWPLYMRANGLEYV